MIDNNEMEKFFSEKYNIVIFGCSNAAVRVVHWMKDYGIPVYLCVDSSKYKQETFFMEEFLICSPDILLYNSNYHIIVLPNKNKEIFELLCSYNYIYGKDFIDFNDILRYWSFLLLSYIQKQNYKVKFIFAPNLQKMLNCSLVEQSLLNMPTLLVDRLPWLLSFPIHIRECYKSLDYYSDEYLNNIFTGSEVLKWNGTYIQKDIKSKYVNVSNGMRLTTNQLGYYESTVHFFGNSYVYGFGVEDKYTLPSCLQRILNNNGFKYVVLNHGIRGMTFEKYINKIKSINIEDDDYVLLYFSDESILKEILIWQSIPYIDMTEFLIKKRDDNIFFDWESHLNYKGNLNVSEKLFELIFDKRNKTNICLFNKVYEKRQKNLSLLKNDYDFCSYIEMLQKVQVNNKNLVTGGIVMNCNPFTLGHQHLIRIASQIVDNLYIFVVSENCSEFNFKDRFQMVKDGTKNFKNVTVLPSGKFILSAVTFPEYFSKDESKYTDIDMSEDIEIFGSIIAKELNITIRFVGEEPNDIVTKQYNDTMKRILPKYNIKVLEIPRIKLNNIYISASIVRKLWHENELQKLKEYVPESTYRYLISMN